MLIDSNPSVLTTRGPLGELPIHLCYLLGGDAQLRIADYMVAKHPDLLVEKYQGEIFYGENVLHIAIVKNKLTVVQALVAAAPQLLTARASGTFSRQTRHAT